jgi:hypothetical protein
MKNFRDIRKEEVELADLRKKLDKRVLKKDA